MVLLLQVILGILFPPAILLMEFRVGDEASHHSSKENCDGKMKDDDNKSSKVPKNRCSLMNFVIKFSLSDQEFVSGRRLKHGRHIQERR